MDPFGLYMLLFFAAQSLGQWEHLWLFSTFHTYRQRDKMDSRDPSTLQHLLQRIEVNS